MWGPGRVIFKQKKRSKVSLKTSIAVILNMCGCDTITSGGEEGCEPLRGEELGAAEDDVLQQVGHPYILQYYYSQSWNSARVNNYSHFFRFVPGRLQSKPKHSFMLAVVVEPGTVSFAVVVLISI